MKKKLILLSEISDSSLTIFFILVSLCVIPVQASVVPPYNGTIVWNKEINGMYSVSLSNDGSLAFATFGGLSLLDSSGNIIWTREPSGDSKIVWSVAISDDGRYIVMGCNDDHAYLYDRSGSLIWECRTAVLGMGGDEINGVGISSDGSYIALGDSKGDIHFLNADGQRLWKFSTDEKIPLGGIGISGDGRYVAAVGDVSNSVYFLSDAGTLLWKRDYTKDKFSVEPRGLAISGDGKYIAVGSTDNNVYFLNNQGNLLWKYNTGNDIRSVALSESGSFVVVGSANDNIYLFNKEGKPLWYYPTGGQNGGVAITKDGKLIAGNNIDQGNVFVLTNPNYLPQGIPPQISGSSEGTSNFTSNGTSSVNSSNDRQKESEKPVGALTQLTQISIVVFLLVVALFFIRYFKRTQ